MLNTAKCSLSQLQLEKHTHTLSLSLKHTHIHTADTTTAYSHFQQGIQVKKEIPRQKPYLVICKGAKPETQRMRRGKKTQFWFFGGFFFHFNCEMLLFQLSWLGEKMTAKLTDKSTLVDHERHFWWWFLSCSLQWTCSMNSNRTDLSMTRDR